MKKMSPWLLIVSMLLISCAGMSTETKLKTAHIVVSTSIDVIYTNAQAICDVQEVQPPECIELQAIYTDVKAVHESVGQSVEKIMDLTKRIEGLKKPAE